MQVTYDEPITDPGADLEDPADDQPVSRRLAGALVRVFGILDNLGHLVNEPEALPPQRGAWGGRHRGDLRSPRLAWGVHRRALMAREV